MRRNIVFVAFAFLLLFAALCFADNLPYELSWGMSKQQIYRFMNKAGFKVWNNEEKLPSNFTKLYFRNDDISPRTRAYILLYRGGLYQIVLRYSEVSDEEQLNMLDTLVEQFGKEQLYFREGGGNFYYWKTENTLIHFLFSGDHDDVLMNITRLSYTDIVTKKKLGPGSP